MTKCSVFFPWSDYRGDSGIIMMRIHVETCPNHHATLTWIWSKWKQSHPKMVSESSHLPTIRLKSLENHFCFAKLWPCMAFLHESWQPSQKITSNLPQSSLIMIQICPTIDRQCHEFSKSALSSLPAAVKGKSVMSKLWNSSWHVHFAPLWSCHCVGLPTSHSSGPFSEQHI